MRNQMAGIIFEKFIYFFSGKTVGSLFSFESVSSKIAPLKRYDSYEKLFYCAMY